MPKLLDRLCVLIVLVAEYITPVFQLKNTPKLKTVAKKNFVPKENLF